MVPGATITRGFLPAFAEKTSGPLIPLLCLAPHGVFPATSLTRSSGGLLPHLFTLTRRASCQWSVVSCQSKSHRSLAVIRRPGAVFPNSLSFFLLATENRPLTTSPAGGLFSVTLSVTWDSHPKYPRFHKACCPSVFGLSSGAKFTPAIACHSGHSSIEGVGDPGGRSAFTVRRSPFAVRRRRSPAPFNVRRRFKELAFVYLGSISFPKLNSNSNSSSYSVFFCFGKSEHRKSPFQRSPFTVHRA